MKEKRKEIILFVIGLIVGIFCVYKTIDLVQKSVTDVEGRVISKKEVLEKNKNGTYTENLILTIKPNDSDLTTFIKQVDRRTYDKFKEGDKIILYDQNRSEIGDKCWTVVDDVLAFIYFMGAMFGVLIVGIIVFENMANIVILITDLI